MNKIEVYSPALGTFKKIEDVADEVFAQKMLGEGFAVEPTSNGVYAPTDAIIETVFFTKHAFGLKTDQNFSILLHLGLDTVSLDGKGFKSLVKTNQRVKQGELIAEMDLVFCVLKKLLQILFLLFYLRVKQVFLFLI